MEFYAGYSNLDFKVDMHAEQYIRLIASKMEQQH